MYPKKYKSIRTGAIVEFTAEFTGKVIDSGISDHKVGFYSTRFLRCTDPIYWEPFDTIHCSDCKFDGSDICKSCSEYKEKRTNLFINKNQLTDCD